MKFLPLVSFDHRDVEYLFNTLLLWTSFVVARKTTQRNSINEVKPQELKESKLYLLSDKAFNSRPVRVGGETLHAQQPPIKAVQVG